MRVNSIRGRLTVTVLLASSAVIVAASTLVYVLVKHNWLREIDASLAANARAIGALCELGEHGVEFEPAASELPEFRPGGHEAYEIWRADGTVIAKSPSLGSAELEFAAPPAGRTHGTWSTLPGERHPRLVRVSVGVNSDRPGARAQELVVVGLTRDVEDLLRMLRRLRLVLFGAWCASSAVLGLVLTWAVPRGLLPLRHLVDEIGGLDASKLERPVGRAGAVPTEMEPVVLAINGLLQRLAAAFARERALTADIAHELRTPLAGLRTTIDVALMPPGPPCRADLERCLTIVGDMQGMVDNVLALARLESGQTVPLLRPIALDELVRECWPPWNDVASSRSLSVTQKLDASIATADRDLLRIVLRNLFSNAVTYCNDGGTIVIASHEETVFATLSVTNTGSAVGPEHTRTVFDRFWRGDAARTGDGSQCGLGLSLCREIVQRQGGRIRARAERGGEFEIEIQLPRALDASGEASA